MTEEEKAQLAALTKRVFKQHGYLKARATLPVPGNYASCKLIELHPIAFLYLLPVFYFSTDRIYILVSFYEGRFLTSVRFLM